MQLHKTMLVLALAGALSHHVYPQWWLNDWQPVGPDSVFVYEAHFTNVDMGLLAMRISGPEQLPAFVLRRTDDGCDTWEDVLIAETPIRVGILDDLMALAHYSTMTGHDLFRTTDAGLTWQGLGLHRVKYFSFPSPALGYGLKYVPATFGGPLPVSEVVRTSDGGTSWEPIFDLTAFSWESPGYISMTVQGSGLITFSESGGPGMVAYTQNAGLNWAVPVTLPFKSAAYGNCLMLGDGIGLVLGTVLGTEPESFIMRTTDGGMNWEQVASNNGRIYRLAFYGDSLGYATTSDGKILRSTDVGATWSVDHVMDDPRQLVAVSLTNPVARVFGEMKDFLVNDWFTGMDRMVIGRMNVFPNPATNSIWFDAASDGLAVVFDASGRIWSIGQVSKGTTELFIGDLASGLYVLMFDGLTAVRFIKM